MNKLFYPIIFFAIIGCSSNNIVYWCGDHPCINKAEKEAYFKKTMIVEMKELKKGDQKNNSVIEKIMEQARMNEKKRIKDEKDLAKQAKLEEKRRIKDEKDLAKQAKLEEKRRIKDEKDLAKQANVEEKRRIKDEKDLAKQSNVEEKRRIKDEKDIAKSIEKNEKISANKQKNEKNQNVKLSVKIGNVEIDSKKFSDLANRILKKNSFRSYPDINDIPN